jgi:hypothetical protein
MASAWAHVISYGMMILLSFILARKYFWIDYRLNEIAPYFVMAVSMVIFTSLIRYPAVGVELLINTILLAIFVAYAQYRDKFPGILLKKDIKD